MADGQVLFSSLVYICIINVYACMFYSTGTLDKNIPMVPISPTTIEGEKPTKLEAETSHQTAATVEERYTIPDIGRNVDSTIASMECSTFVKSPSKVS